MQEFRIAHFRIIEEFGKDALTINYGAFDESLQREVMVRVLNPEHLSNVNLVEQFVQGARASSRVNHQHVIQIYFVGVEGNVPFIVQELVKGKSLEHTLASMVRLPEAMVLTLALEGCEGLQCAYNSGLIHLDIQPANITIDDRNGVKIGNFGRAMLVDHVVRDPKKTGYIPPEQLLGQTVDHRSDIYGLGATMYHALTGRPPFLEEEIVQFGRGNKDLQLIPVERFVPSVSGHTSQIVTRMLALNVGGRYSGYEQIMADIYAAQDSVVVAKKTTTRKVISKKVASKKQEVGEKVRSAEVGPVNEPDPKRTQRKRVMGVPARIFWIIAVVLMGLGVLWVNNLKNSDPGSGSSDTTSNTPVSIIFRPHASEMEQSSLRSQGYLVDVGEVFGEREGKRKFGWKEKPKGGWIFNESRGFTLPHSSYLVFGMDAVWEMQVTPGIYEVTVTAPPDMAKECVFEILAEGMPVLATVPGKDNKEVIGRAIVSVKDGRVTLSSGGKSFSNLISTVAIAPHNGPVSQAMNVRLDVAGNGKALESPVSLTLEAQIQSSAPISSATFYSGCYLLGRATSAPWKITTPVLGIGQHPIRVAVVAQSDQTALSEVMMVRVTGSNPIPTALRINFQPRDIPIIEGSLPDYGESYGDRGNGNVYGWLGGNTLSGKNYRDGRLIRTVSSQHSLDEYHDTWGCLIQNAKPIIWEIKLPKGKYQVRAVVGGPWSASVDTPYKTRRYKVLAENTILVDGYAQPQAQWIDGFTTVEVTDGNLTIQAAPECEEGYIAFIDLLGIQ